MKVNNFDVLKVMGQRSMDVQLAPLNNVVRAKAVKAGTQVTIGVAGNPIAKILNGELVGGLLLADKKQFDQVKAELEATGAAE